MKKEYSKPQIVFESFQLSTSIASGCAHEAEYADANSCTYTENGWVLFAGAEGCMEGSDTLALEICYHAPTESGSIFGS